MINYKNSKVNNIPELKIGNNKLKSRFEFRFGLTKIKQWWLNFKFNININF